MKYDRLTKRDEEFGIIALCNACPRKGTECCTAEETEGMCCIEEQQNRLAELEDKIEQGTLIELPFITQDARGDWRVHFYSKRFNTIDCYVCYDREEAEKRLKELQE